MTTKQEPGKDALISELRAALAVRPSAKFEDRVRGAIRDEARPASASRVTWILAAAAGIVLVLVAGRMLWMAPVDPSPLQQVATDIVGVPAPVSTAPAPVEPEVRVVAGAAVGERGANGPAKGSAEPASQMPAERALEVLVPQDEVIALQRLVDAIREGRAAVPAETGPELDADGRLAKPAAIEIPLIPVSRVEPLPPPGSGGLRREL